MQGVTLRKKTLPVLSDAGRELRTVRSSLQLRDAFHGVLVSPSAQPGNAEVFGLLLIPILAGWSQALALGGDISA